MSRTHLLSFPLKSYLLLRHPSARDNRQNLFTGLIRSNLFHSTFNLTLFVCLSREDNARSHACRHFKCSVQRELGATKSIDASRNLDFSSFLPSNSMRLSSALHATCAFSLSLLFYDKVEHPLSAALSLKLPFLHSHVLLLTQLYLSIIARSLGSNICLLTSECRILAGRKFFIHESISCLRLRVTMMDWSFNGRCHEIKPTDSLFFTGFVFSLNIWLLSHQCAALKDKKLQMTSVDRTCNMGVSYFSKSLDKKLLS